MSSPKFRPRDLTYIAVFAALLAVCSWISIPAAVPFTLQTLGIFLAVGLLGGRRGTLVVLVYILMAAVGLPVLSGFRGGVGALLGNTGGDVLGFLLGLLVCYAFGTAWFMALYIRANGAVSLWTVLGWCVIPFILPDLLKIAGALALTARLRRHIA